MDKATPPKVESSLDRFEHEIEELERPVGRGQWILAIAASAGLITIFVLLVMMRS